MATGIPVAVGELIDVATINSWARGYFRKSTSKTVNTTTTATDLLNSEFTLPAGALGTTKVLRLTAWGNFKQNTGSARAVPAFDLLLGGTTLLAAGHSFSATAVASDANRWGWRITCEVQNLAAANSQIASMDITLAYNASTTGLAQFDTGNGLVAADSNGVCRYLGTNSGLAVDTTAACAVALKVQNANNGANYETKLLGALAEII